MGWTRYSRPGQHDLRLGPPKADAHVGNDLSENAWGRKNTCPILLCGNLRYMGTGRTNGKGYREKEYPPHHLIQSPAQNEDGSDQPAAGPGSAVCDLVR